MTIVPITLKTANEFIAAHHRHHKPTRGHKWSIGLEHNNEIVGVAIVGRPVARGADTGLTAGGQWKHTDGKERRTDQPIEKKQRWAKEL